VAIYLIFHEFHVTLLHEVWIFGGTTEIMKEIIGRGLGRPLERQDWVAAVWVLLAMPAGHPVSQ
jgi:hypothetical protein